MSIAQSAPNHIRAIAAYVPGKPSSQLARELDLAEKDIIKLASNENPRGMSPKARAAVQAALDGVARYPDQYELVDKVAALHGVNANQIVLGSGSNDLLDIVARCFLEPGKSAVSSQYAFPIYPIATLSAGGENIIVAAKDHGHDLDAMLAAIREDTRLIWIANPNNPSGTFAAEAAVRAFIEKVPAHIVIMLDEAYKEYLPPEHQMDSISWVKEFPNLLVARTFSKAYGLAGLRVGYALTSPEVADLLNRVRLPFNVNNLALVGAIAALDDQDYVQESYQLNLQERAKLLAGFEALGLTYIPPFGNFVAVNVGNAKQVSDAVQLQGIIVRPISVPGHVRVTVGLPEENQRFLTVLAGILSPD